MQNLTSGADAKKARETANLSLAAVASSVGMNRTYYSLFESGRRALTAEQHQSLERLFSEQHANNSQQARDSEPRKRKADEAPPSITPQKIESKQKEQCNPASSPMENNHVKLARRRLAALEELAASGELLLRPTIQAIERGQTSLRSLEYSELYKLAEELNLVSNVIQTPSQYTSLTNAEKQRAETLLEQGIICIAIQGQSWLKLNRKELHQMVCKLRKAIPHSGKLVEFPSLLDEFLESATDASNTTERLRLETASHLVECIRNRIAIA